MFQVEVDVEQRADSVVGAWRIHISDAAGQVIDVATFHGRWHLQRGLGHVVDAIGLAQLFVLQLLDVAERLHARAGSVNVAARFVPARRKRGEAIKPTLTQELVVRAIAARLKIDRPPGFVLAVFHARIAVHARLDRVYHRHPRIKVAGRVQVLDGT